MSGVSALVVVVAVSVFDVDADAVVVGFVFVIVVDDDEVCNSDEVILRDDDGEADVIVGKRKRRQPDTTLVREYNKFALCLIVELR